MKDWKVMIDGVKTVKTLIQILKMTIQQAAY